MNLQRCTKRTKPRQRRIRNPQSAITRPTHHPNQCVPFYPTLRLTACMGLMLSRPIRATEAESKKSSPRSDRDRAASSRAANALQSGQTQGLPLQPIVPNEAAGSERGADRGEELDAGHQDGHKGEAHGVLVLSLIHI